MNFNQLISVTAVLIFTLISNLYAATVDLKINNSSSYISVPSKTPLSFSLSLNQQGNTDTADWWLVYYFDNSWYYFNATQGAWEKGLNSTYQGLLFSFNEDLLLLPEGLPSGDYTFFWAIDIPADGQLGPEYTYDFVSISVQDPDKTEYFSVDIFDTAKVMPGNTLFAYSHGAGDPKVVIVDGYGSILWSYELPDNLKRYSNPGFDAELLSNDNILIVLPGYGLIEINQDGETVWTHQDIQTSHDADRLSNGNTLYVFGNADTIDDCQIKEVDEVGSQVWCWKAKDYFNREPYIDIQREGWTHANAADRLSNGNTLISLRNFNLTIEVDSNGDIVWQYDWSILGGDRTDPHEPEIQQNDNILVCLQQDSPYRAIEVDRTSGQLIWSYNQAGLQTTRDCDRLENGNTLIVGVFRNTDESVMLEITPNGEIVWQMTLKGISVEGRPGWFYKAQRI